VPTATALVGAPSLRDAVDRDVDDSLEEGVVDEFAGEQQPQVDGLSTDSMIWRGFVARVISRRSIARFEDGGVQRRARVPEAAVGGGESAVVRRLRGDGAGHRGDLGVAELAAAVRASCTPLAWQACQSAAHVGWTTRPPIEGRSEPVS